MVDRLGPLRIDVIFELQFVAAHQQEYDECDGDAGCGDEPRNSPIPVRSGIDHKLNILSELFQTFSKETRHIHESAKL